MKEVDKMTFDELFSVYKEIVHKMAREHQDRIGGTPHVTDDVYMLTHNFLHWCNGHRSDWHPDLAMFE